MELDIKKKYIMRFMSEGLDFDNSCKMVYLSKKESESIKSDDEFIEKCEMVRLEIVADKLKYYNLKVLGSNNPSDNLKQLAYLAPEVFEAENGNGVDIRDEEIKPFQIHVGDGSIEEVK